jgi:tRNA dimethylallyltransferase
VEACNIIRGERKSGMRSNENKEHSGGGGKTPSPLVTIVGPTSVGKTRLALRLAKELGAEIVSADSRQLYRGMDIGTDKPTAKERQRVPHHLVDIVDPDEEFTLAQYQDMAYAAIDDVLARSRVPFLVGGTGLYIKAVVEGWSIPRARPNEALRAELYREAEVKGEEALHARLRQVDPVAAEKIDPRNVRRVVRALEVYLETGRLISELQGRNPPPYRILQIGLTMERSALYQRIDQRIDRMIERGLVEEVRGLVEQGYGYELPAMSGLGYRQVGGYLRGEISLEEAIHLIKRDTRRFVRQQYNWFRLNDERIHWFQALDDPYERIKGAILQFLGA